MWQRLLSISIVAAFSIVGIVLSLYFLTILTAALSCLFILVTAAIIVYLIRPSKTEGKSLGSTAITTIAALTGTNPLWAKLLATKGPEISTAFPEIFRDVEFGFLLTTSIGVVAIVFIVWLNRRDPTIGGEKPGNVADEIGEIGFKDKLIRMAQVLETRLTSMDDETNWTDQAFTPLDAEIEKVSITGGRPRKIVDLITAIRRDHSSTGFLVLGDPGSGKSVAMRRLAREMLREVPRTQVLPIYVNLKEWADSHQLALGRPADVFHFIIEYLKSTGNDLIIDFCDTYLRRLLEVGRLFIIFDSFDETPVLLDQDETSAVIKDLSKNLEEFMIGPHKSRFVIASRYFRRPRFLSSRVSVLEILSMSDRKIRETLVKSNRLSREEIDRFFRSRNQWISYAKNPFVANLVVNFISNNEGRLPLSKIGVYEDYIQARLARMSSVIAKYCLAASDVVRYATLTSYEMFSRDNIGLEADLDDVCDWMKQKYKLDATRNAIDVLVRARLLRCSPYPEQRISFIHRRFNEYFLALAAQQRLMQVDLEAITTDRRDRDALVLYVELANDAEALRILQFCWGEIAGRRALMWSGEDIGESTSPERIELRITYCLRFVVDAFTSSKRHIVDAIASELLEYLTDAVGQHSANMLRAKIAVETAGVLSDHEAGEIIFLALGTKNYWITETAIRAARNIQNISFEPLQRIRHHIWEMPDLEILKKRRDFVDLFRLNSSFRTIPFILNVKAAGALLLWPARIASIALFPVLCAWSLLPFLYTASFAFMPWLIGRATELWRRREFSRQRKWLARLPDLNALFLFAMLFYILSLFDAKVDWASTEAAEWFGWSVGLRNSDFIRNGPVVLALLAGSVSTRRWAQACYIAHGVYSWARELTPSSVAPLIHSGIHFLVGKLRALTAKKAAKLVLILSGPLVIGVGILSALVATIEYISPYIAPYLAPMAHGLEYVSGACFIALVIVVVYKEFDVHLAESARLKEVPPVKYETRASIQEVFMSFRFAYLRNRLVQRLEDHHRKMGSKPQGEWPNGAVPNLGDKASIRLSQLEEVWIGLDR
jgi:hypothetical protein